MEVLRPPRGLIIDLITPLNSSGGIDGRGLKRQIERVLPYAQGLLLASPYMGEGRDLGPEHREEILEKCIEVVQARVPILFWISSDTEEKTKHALLLLNKCLDRWGYKGRIFWVDTPLFYRSNRGLPSYYRGISSLTSQPFILHNDAELIKALVRPFRRANIRTNILKCLAQMGEIQGLIFSGPLDRANNYQRAVRSRSDFRIYDGDESHFLVHPSLSGIISMGANLAPRAWGRITASSLSLDGKGYPDSQRQIWETGRFLTDMREIYDKNPLLLLKHALWEMGVIESPSCININTDAFLNGKAELGELIRKYADHG